ncbi:Bug family tripartite tricarboxylate transporter substrate binding protein [Ottowia thiooxydans]|uniref:Tripartite-type tricarboxylate transporter receptor subunit TctC n=1 Tax=Ottowia thiooxydans TaxID=219182 RepID=A0ABV2Q364_9BURK
MKRRDLLSAVSAGLALLKASSASAQTRPVSKISVGFSPGGSTDVIARLLTNAASATSDGPLVVVENVSGAAGRIAITRVKAAPPDGSSVLVTPLSLMTLYPHVYKKLGYNPLVDFTPVTAIGQIAFALVVSNDVVPSSIRNIQDLAAWYGANPSKATYASGGAGTPMHFVGEMLAKFAGLKLVHAPYKGGTPMIQDLLGGHVSTGITVIGEILPHLESKKVRVIAVTSPTRSNRLPEVPTFVESGAPGIVAQEYFGVFLPRFADASKVSSWERLVKMAVSTPQAKETLRSLACEPYSASPSEFAQLLKSDYERWAPYVKASGFSIDE